MPFVGLFNEDRAIIPDTIEESDDIDNMVNDSDDSDDANDFVQSSKRRVLLGEDWLRFSSSDDDDESEDLEQEGSNARSALSIPRFSRSRIA